MIKGLWTNLDYLRFNPSRINSIQMILAAVMNGKGNGNKDEVEYKLYDWLFINVIFEILNRKRIKF